MVEVDLEYVNTTGRLLTRWRDAGPGARPALALLPQQLTQRLADSGQTVAPGRCLAEAIPDVVPSIAATWSVDGVAQAMPFEVSTPVLFYNRRLFEAAGLDPEAPPTDMASMRAVSERLVATGAAKHGLVVDNNRGGVTTWIVEQWNAQAGAPTLAPDNGYGSLPRRAAWRDGPAVDAFAWLHGMIEDQLAVLIDNDNGVRDLLEAADPDEPIGMTFHTCASLGELIDVLASSEDFAYVDLDVAALPGPGTGSLPGGDALWMANGLTDAEMTAAWALEMWLTSPEVQARWAAGTGYVPVTQAAATLEPLRQRWLDHPEMAVAYEAVLGMGTRPTDLGMQAGPEQEIGGALAMAFQRVREGISVEEALDEAADITDALLEAYAGTR
ncbi:MAG: extracellular solute-binding protein [Acidimicrobiales bacterium]